MVCLCLKSRRNILIAAFIFLEVLSLSSVFVKSTDAYNITVTFDSTEPADLSVGGDVNSSPSGLSCTDGSSGVCSYLFTDSIEITLAANPNWKSNFHGWGAPCTTSGTGPCVFTPNANATVNATFSPDYQATVLGMFFEQYTTLTEAYANANDQSTVAAHVYTFSENLILNNPIFIRLYGGREGIEYLSHLDSYFTTLNGYLEIQNGSVEIDSLIIQ